MKKAGLGLLLLLSLLPLMPVNAQSYSVVTVDFRELQLVPEDMHELSSIDAFQSEEELAALLEDDDTMFWEVIGSYDASFASNSSLSSYAIVQVNQSGFYQTIVALNAQTMDLEWYEFVDSNFTENYTLAVTTATDFFADDGHYWGLSEEIVLVPGEYVGLDFSAIWLFKFYLVGETERWTLMIDTNGFLQNYLFSDIPCQDCTNYTPLVIVAFSASIILVVMVGYIIRKRNFGS